jgi:hypothetical protein
MQHRSYRTRRNSAPLVASRSVRNRRGQQRAESLRIGTKERQ